MARCSWTGEDAEYISYHDEEWGRPVDDDHRLFEKLCLEGFQAGLSWLTILRKRATFRRAFADFDPRVVARFDEADVARLLLDAGIVRHRGKIEATVQNARATLEVQDELGSLRALVWRFEPGPAARPARVTTTYLHSTSSTPESKALSKELERRGFRFVGPTTAYAFMQAMGLVNDHVEGCPARARCADERRLFDRG